jgi:cold-inducible RNA-binding protein
MGSKLYVGNLSFDTTDQELEQAFSEYGEVVSAVIVRDRDTDRSKGFGFVEFAQNADVQKAKEGMNGKELNGRTIKVDEAREPNTRSGGGGGGGRRSNDRGGGGGGGFNRRSRF